MIKNKIIMALIFLLIFATSAYAKVPKFKVHVLRDLAPGCNYSINTPVVFDYDGDGDLDVILVTKDGTVYLLENITIA